MPILEEHRIAHPSERRQLPVERGAIIGHAGFNPAILREAYCVVGAEVAQIIASIPPWAATNCLFVVCRSQEDVAACHGQGFPAGAIYQGSIPRWADASIVQHQAMSDQEATRRNIDVYQVVDGGVQQIYHPSVEQTMDNMTQAMKLSGEQELSQKFSAHYNLQREIQRYMDPGDLTRSIDASPPRAMSSTTVSPPSSMPSTNVPKPRPGQRAASNRATAAIPKNPQEGIPRHATAGPASRPKRPGGGYSTATPPRPGARAASPRATAPQPRIQARTAKMGRPAGKPQAARPRIVKQPGTGFKADMANIGKGIGQLPGIASEVAGATVGKIPGVQTAWEAGKAAMGQIMPKGQAAKQKSSSELLLDENNTTGNAASNAPSGEKVGDVPQIHTPNPTGQSQISDKEFRARTGKTRAQHENALFRKKQQLENLQRVQQEKGTRFKEQAKQLGIAGLRGFAKRGGLVDLGLRAIGNSGRANDRDSAIRREMDWREKQVRDQIDHHQAQLDRGNAPEQAGHGYNQKELAQLKHLGLDPVEMWQKENGPGQSDPRSPSVTERPAQQQTPQKQAPKGRSPNVSEQRTEGAKGWGRGEIAQGMGSQGKPQSLREQSRAAQQEPAPEPVDTTGLGHDPDLSQHDGMHEMLMPEQAQKYRQSADDDFELYQQMHGQQMATPRKFKTAKQQREAQATREKHSQKIDNAALNAAAKYRQLKLHGYDHDMPHSAQGLKDMHEKNVERTQDLGLARQWHEHARADRKDPSDFGSAAMQNIEKHFEGRGIDIRQEVLKAISRSKKRSLITDLQTYQKAFRDTKSINPSYHLTNEQRAGKKTLNELRKKYTGKNLDIDAVARKEARRQVNINPQLKAQWQQRWDERAEKAQAAEQQEDDPMITLDGTVDPDAPTLGELDLDDDTAAPDLPEMVHPAHFDDEQQEDATAMRAKMAETLAQPDPAIQAEENEFFGDPDEAEEVKDPLLAWTGQSAQPKNDLEKAIIEEVGDDYILNHFMKAEIQKVKETDLDVEGKRDTALKAAVQNILGTDSKKIDKFMKRVARAEDVHSKDKDTGELLLPEIDLMAQAMDSDPTLAEALITGPRVTGGAEVDNAQILLESLKQGFGKHQNRHATWIQKALVSLGGWEGLNDIHAKYYPPKEDEDVVPFAIMTDIERFATDWAEQTTRRELHMDHDLMTINRFAITPVESTTLRPAADPFTQRFAAHWDLIRLTR